LDAGESGGFLETKTFTFEGERLEINARAERGEIRLEILDGESGRIIPGFSQDVFSPFRGDAVDHEATWPKSPGVGALADHPIRLRFHLRQASLFAFGFQRQADKS
jgi:hypothetical protein